MEYREHVVFTREAYEKHYGADARDNTLVETMKLAFSAKIVLFLGCSLDTDRVLDVLESCCDHREYYALVGFPEETENQDDAFAPLLVNPDGRENAVYRKRRQAAHEAVVENLPQIFYLLERMIAEDWLDRLSGAAFAMANSMLNYFQFSSVQGIIVCKKVASAAEKKEENLLWAQATRRRGDLHSRLGEIKKAEAAYEEAEKLYRAERDQLGLANTLLSRGTLLFINENFSGAHEAFCQALIHYRTERTPYGIAITCAMLALALVQLNRRNEVDALVQEAKMIAQKLPESQKEHVLSIIAMISEATP